MALCKAKPPQALIEAQPPGEFFGTPVQVDPLGTCSMSKGHEGDIHSDGNGHIWGLSS